MTEINNTIHVAYSPTDFFYVSAGEVVCTGIANENEKNKCDDYKKAIDTNKQHAEWIQTVQNKHSGSDQNHADTHELYLAELQRTANLGVGILGTIMYIYFNM